MRRESRELAMQILFQTEFAPQISYETFMEVFETSYDKETIRYADQLIRGVQENQKAIDDKIQDASRHWKLDRMTSIDRNVLRVAVYEMKFAKQALEVGIIINEAIDIAKKYGTTESGAFVNGLLDQVAKGS